MVANEAWTGISKEGKNGQAGVGKRTCQGPEAMDLSSS